MADLKAARSNLKPICGRKRDWFESVSLRSRDWAAAAGSVTNGLLRRRIRSICGNDCFQGGADFVLTSEIRRRADS
jgi:hypothetical protein